MTVGGTGVEFGDRCVTCRECGAEEEDCRNKGLLAERGSSIVTVEDADFYTKFDSEKCLVEHFLKGEPLVRRNKVRCNKHSLKGEVRFEFKTEVNRWIEEGIMIPESEVTADGVLPWMPVFQPTKNKVRSVLSFGEVSEYVSCHVNSNAADVCGEILCE